MNVRVSNGLYARYFKRIFDICLSLVLLLLLIPLLVVISILVLIDVGKPILFKTYRPGKDGVLFQLYKFHDLNNATDSSGNLLPPDKRVTAIGYFLRRSSLDELPQLFNILKGDMSFIGPRPLLKEYLSFYTPRQNMRHTIRPGLECPSLVERDHPRTWEEQFEDDVWYVENINVKTDFRMFCKLFKMVLNKNDSKRRAKASRGYFGAMTIDEITEINRGYKESLK